MPWTSKLSVGAQDALDERSSIMGALGPNSLDRAGGVDKEDLCVQALNFHLLLIAWLQIQRSDAFQLVFLSHDCD